MVCQVLENFEGGIPVMQSISFYFYQVTVLFLSAGLAICSVFCFKLLITVLGDAGILRRSESLTFFCTIDTPVCIHTRVLYTNPN